MEDNQEKDIKIKVAVLGDSGVGKSCLIAVFSAIKSNRTENFTEILDDASTTVGCDFVAVKLAMPNNKSVKMNIWDTAGQEKYRAINRNLYLGAQGALLCFDSTRRLVVDDVDLWRREVQEHASTKCSIIIVGTKSDMEVNAETRELLEKYAKANGFPFIETSAKLGTNVQEAFKLVASEILANAPKTKSDKPSDRDNGGFNLVPDASKNGAAAIRKSCC